MSEQQQSILIVDDESNMRHMLRILLGRHGYAIEEAEGGEDGLRLLEGRAFTYVLCDVRMPGMDGLEFLEKAHARYPEITIIMMSAYGTIEDAVQAMRLGAYDYIAKPFKEDEILLVLQKAGERNMLLAENRELKARIGEEVEKGFGTMVGKSPAMREVFALAAKVAGYDTTVLITGESGTGKELVARGIHAESRRREKPFIAVNCGSIPQNLLESEFFGYRKGSFTGADTDKKGLFAEADGGSLFLDEIGELPLEMQVKLLRVLQEREFRPLGGVNSEPVDVRILAATAKDLGGEAQQGRFRLDLYYRLNVLNIHLPPLKERNGDISVLAYYFLKRIAGRMELDIRRIHPAAMEYLLAYHWPGNVRELENVIERAVVLTDGNSVTADNLPETVTKKTAAVDLPGELFNTLSVKKAKKLLECRLITQALEQTGGNKSRAAELLELSYPALLQKIKEYKLNQA